MPGTTALVDCHRKAGRGGIDRYQAVLCSLGTWPPRCTYSLLLHPSGKKKKRQAVESISTAKLSNMNYSIFNHYSPSALHSLIPKNLGNKSLCGCQILAFSRAVPGSTRDP